MNAADFVSRLGAKAKPSPAGAGWQCRCPAHEDGKASLSVRDNGDKVLVHCHAGCTPQAVCDAANVTLADLFNGAKPQRYGNGNTLGTMVAAYDYRDEGGNLLCQAVRFEPKDFRQRRPDATAQGGWTWKLGDVRRVLYRLPETIQAVQDGFPVVVAEGEKDCDALAKLGFSATCNLGGAGKWRPEYSETLRGAQVYVVADKDAPGRQHAQAVAASLAGVASFVAVLELPDYAGRTVKDAADYIGAGGTASELSELFDTAPEWKPQAAQPATSHKASPVEADRPTAANFAEVTAWIRGETLRTLADKETLPTVKNSLVAKLVVDALAQVGRFYFHADLRDFASALYFNAHTKRLERIRSDVFLSWLSNWLVINRASGLFKYVSSEVETAALSSAHTTGILPEAYFAARPQALYLSCGDGLAVRITADGVATVDNGTDGVLFAAGKTLAPWKLVEPRDAFETCAIFRNAHSSAQHGRTLLQLWLYSFATMPRSKPPLGAIGEIGCGKTRTLKGIAELYGFPFRAAKVEEQLEPNFWPNVNEGGLFVLDNADTKCRWLADAVAAAATDGCSQRRKLYTNSETVTLRANSWLAITAANPTFGNDAGLADRLLVVRMARRDGDESSDAGLTDEILANRDAGLSHLAETLGRALADTAPVPSGLNKRHPDFAAFAVRIGRALGREAEAVAALSAAEADKSAFCLENDTIGAALVAYLRTENFHGTAAELVPKLVEQDAELQDRLSAKRLGKRLAAIWPHLQSALAVAKKETDRKNFTVFQFKSAEFAEFEMDFPQKS